ncbi:MAG: shikimate dehydrogenase [Simkania negevensis]|nr:shikimate dehydrogenase [Simkania negevensis]
MVKTPEDLPALLQKIRSFPAEVFKIATRANSSLDALRMLIFIKEVELPCVGLCMGKLGELTRIAAPLTKGIWTYAPLYPNEELAGKITAERLHTIYHYPSLNQKTAFYALLGNPLDSSRGEIVYNQAFQVANKNALYCKIPLHKKELSSFFSLSQKLPFSGFSITMPLKEAILPFIDYCEERAKKIGAINTLVSEGRKWRGANTDGIGALRAIKEKLRVKGKRVALIGCGGVARAIAYELTKEEIALVISHRDQKKAELFAADFNCSTLSLKEIENTLSSFDLLINATPLGMAPYLKESPIDPKFLFSNLTVFDVVSQPEETFLLREARKRGCKTISGSKMYEYQAIGQRERWFRN